MKLGLILSLLASCSAQIIQLKDPYCSPNVLSCHWSGTVDACCSPKYGLVVLALQWAPGYGPNDQFTIHGLWPDTCSGGYGPSRGCDSSRRSNAVGNIIRDHDPVLYSRMRTFWPSNKDDNNWFWSHEWTKHGTCVSTLRPTCYGPDYTKYQDVLDYFKKTLDLRDQFDLFGALNLNGVSPGRVYNVQTIRDAIKKAFGATAKLDCLHGSLSEVSLNFYVKGTSDYVITDVLDQGNCRGAVNYPRK
ncbi:ribonuclease T2 [Blakeslea trispora]|nr:ribonuclease T2 [Blakeslea trispora]